MTDVAEETFTRPAAPPRIGSPDVESTAAPTANDNEKLAPTWEIGTRSVSNVPRESAEFNVVGLGSERHAAPEQPAALKVGRLWGDARGTTNVQDVTITLIASTAEDGLAGFEIEGRRRMVSSAWGSPAEGVPVRPVLDQSGLSFDADKGRGIGPWTISSAFNVSKPSISLSSSRRERESRRSPRSHQERWNKDCGIQVESRQGRRYENALRCETPSGAGHGRMPFSAERQQKRRYP